MAQRRPRKRLPDGDLTPAQLELMDLVWERGELSAPDAHASGRRLTLCYLPDD